MLEIVNQRSLQPVSGLLVNFLGVFHRFLQASLESLEMVRRKISLHGGEPLVFLFEILGFEVIEGLVESIDCLHFCMVLLTVL